MKKYELTCNDDNILKTINEDLIGRNQKLMNLIKLLNVLDKNFILSIDGDWGVGKTFFVKQLKYICDNANEVDFPEKLNNEITKEFAEKYIAIYYNAWENDSHDDALESLIYNILNDYPEYKEDISNSEELYKMAIPILKNVVEKLTWGFVTKDCFDKFKTFQDLADSIITTEEKIEALNKLFNLILSHEERLLLIVDELDRCRPDFAIKMLEVLKHFCNNDKITILVVTNNVQLTYTINNYYGNGFNGYAYLNRIYDTIITLDVENIEDYAKKVLNIKNRRNLPDDVSYLLFKYFKFSYRECNKYMSMYNLVKKYTEYTDDFNKEKYLFASCVIMPMAIALKIHNLEEYNKFIEGNGENIISDLLNKLDSLDDDVLFESWFRDLLNIGAEENLEEAFIKLYKETITKQNDYSIFPFFSAISMLGNLIDLS